MRSAHVLFWWSGLNLSFISDGIMEVNRSHHFFLNWNRPKTAGSTILRYHIKWPLSKKIIWRMSSLADKLKRPGMISSKPCPPQDCQKYYASDHTWPSGLVGDCWLFRGSKGLDTRLRGAWRAMPCQPMLPTTTSAQVHVEIKSHLDHFSSHSLIKIPMKFNASIMHYDEKLIANVYLSYTSKDRLSPAIRNWRFTLNETTVAIRSCH